MKAAIEVLGTEGETLLVVTDAIAYIREHSDDTPGCAIGLRVQEQPHIGGGCVEVCTSSDIESIKAKLAEAAHG